MTQDKLMQLALLLKEWRDEATDTVAYKTREAARFAVVEEFFFDAIREEIL